MSRRLGLAIACLTLVSATAAHAQAIVGSGWGLLELRPMRVSLEEIFLSLTTEETSAPTAEEPVNA